MNGTADYSLAFVCGGMRFVLARDEAGRWDHNRHGEKVLAKFGSGEEISQIRVVDALCDLMTEGLVPHERAASTAQGCYALSEGKSCKTVWELDKSIMFLALAAQRVGSDPQSEDFPSFKKWGYTVSGRFHISESLKKRHRHSTTSAPETRPRAEWLRKAVSLCDEIAKQVSEGVKKGASLGAGRLLVARSAANADWAWRTDPCLWSDYLRWALPKSELWDLAVDCLSGAMDDRNLPFGEGALLSGVLKADDFPTDQGHPATTLFSYLRDGDHHSPYWVLVPQAHSDLEVRVPYVGKMVAAAAKRVLMMEALNGHRSGNALAEYDFTGGFVQAAEELWENSVPINVFGYEAPVVLWKSAFREIADASLAANSLRFGPTARNMEECLLDSFEREGHPTWSPIYGRLADLAADAFAAITKTWFPGKGEIGSMIHKDLSKMFKTIETRRFRP